MNSLSFMNLITLLFLRRGKGGHAKWGNINLNEASLKGLCRRGEEKIFLSVVSINRSLLSTLVLSGE